MLGHWTMMSPATHHLPDGMMLVRALSVISSWLLISLLFGS